MAREKKTEKLEVRLTHSEKIALQMEAKASGQSVSQLVRSVLQRHIQAQPYFELALQPVRKHPRKTVGLVACITSAIGLGLLLSPAAHTEELALEVLGSMEQVGREYRHVSRFSSQLTLDESGQGVLEIPNDQKHGNGRVNLLPPHRFEVSVHKQASDDDSTAGPDYFVTIRVIRADESNDYVVAEPALTTTINAISNLEFTSDENVRYALTARVIPSEDKHPD